MSRGRNIVIGAVLGIALAVGIYLIVAPSGGADMSIDGIRSRSSLAIPDDAEGFLTASQDDDSQIDITFLLPDQDAVAEFVDDSGLPEPRQGERLILHSSPMWKLNPEGVEPEDYSATTDESSSLIRVVEFVPEDDAVRVRAVLTPR